MPSYTPVRTVLAKSKTLGKCHVCGAVDESYTIAQWSLVGIPVVRLGIFSNLACKVYFQECKSETRGLKPP